MTQYEYQVVRLKMTEEDKQEEILNELGHHGWELVDIRPSTYYSEKDMLMTLMRKNQ